MNYQRTQQQKRVSNWFGDRTLVIATAHGKEMAIAPVLERMLGVNCVASECLNTDALGTFTGEIDRTLSPRDAAIRKCELAMEQTGCDLAVASEGSFGPHPASCFLPADEEVLVFVDRKHALEFEASLLSTATNFSIATVEKWPQLLEFAVKAGFPEHGLILRDPEAGVSSSILKGIRSHTELREAFEELSARFGKVRVETDMRACYNPSRMKVITQTAMKLAVLATCHCPACHTPGYGKIMAKAGLPCSNCGLPTRIAKTEILHCRQCEHSEERAIGEPGSKADPMHCDVCNP